MGCIYFFSVWWFLPSFFLDINKVKYIALFKNKFTQFEHMYFFSTGYINRKYLSNTIKKSMGIIMLSLKVWEKIDYRKYMHYKNMDLFQLCHYCLGAYRPGRKCFILCVTLSSKENALFCVIYFFYFIGNRTFFFFFFNRFLSSASDVKKTVSILYQLPRNSQLKTVFDPQWSSTNFLWKQNAQRVRTFYILFHIFFIMNLFLSPAKFLTKYSNPTI